MVPHHRPLSSIVTIVANAGFDGDLGHHLLLQLHRRHHHPCPHHSSRYLCIHTAKGVAVAMVVTYNIEIR